MKKRERTAMVGHGDLAEDHGRVAAAGAGATQPTVNGHVIVDGGQSVCRWKI